MVFRAALIKAVANFFDIDIHSYITINKTDLNSLVDREGKERYWRQLSKKKVV